MRFTEITRRLTGLSCPVFGLSWSPAEAEVTAAKRIIAFLEDRRVLYNPTEAEIPAHCVASVQNIRAFLTSELEKQDQDATLTENLLAMRAACRKFMDAMQRLDERERIILVGPIGNAGSYSAWVFLQALGELRAMVGLHVALIAVRNGLDVENDLATILPADPSNDV